ncbi:MAG TPA: inositol monophosphatase family protein [Kouleothrix sp.]|nr:inositol monophosphatase family protein [Kouleothrix sp.]
MSDVPIEFPLRWAREAGAIALRSFNHAVAQRKPDHTWVTEADVTIERLLVSRITEHFPTHGIIGEEQTRRTIDHEFLWAIDPLDGTAIFLAGLPTWGVSIGLLRHGQPYLGVIYLPLLNDCYWSVPGSGAFWNDQLIHVAAPRPCTSDDWISTPSTAHRRYTIDFIGKTRSIGATIGAFCYTARGSAIGALINTFAIWDVAAGLAILQAAGGGAAELSGTPFDVRTILDGSTFTTPVLLGAPEYLAVLHKNIHLRTPAL